MFYFVIRIYGKINVCTLVTMSKGGDKSCNTIQVDSPNVQYTDECIESTVDYPVNYVTTNKNNSIVVKFPVFICLFKFC